MARLATDQVASLFFIAARLNGLPYVRAESANTNVCLGGETEPRDKADSFTNG